ncbi:kinase [Sandarakinorhabdus sp. DWP1-3-1]|uniref:kinase n=1 Tax=Sandarakinorhabdus sp. DWP1-3-1 TaxID=2804627 RepID=UPI003CE73E46
MLIGINGVQGSGKSTACLFLERLLAGHGLSAVTLSLDDLYLSKAARARLAATVHPLFATRGVPGTHDVAMGQRTIAALLMGHGPVTVPRFDKGRDAPVATLPSVMAPVDVLLFEGWCIGATPQPESTLRSPVNALESMEDPDSTWRRAVNAALGGDYARLFGPIDLLVALLAPDFGVVSGWRRQQEMPLRAQGLGMDDTALDRFIQHFERLSRHLLATMPGQADIIVPIAENHTAGAVQWRDRPAADRC